jgi:ribosomal protein S18 acetylase RimI-like enzyme
LPQIYDRQLIRSRLERERPWTAYALADLEPGYFENTAWFCDADGLALTLLYRGFSIPILFCIEGSGCLESVLNGIDRALGAITLHIVVKSETVPLIRSRYRIEDERPMLRMMLNAQHYRPAPIEHVTRLGPGHLNAVQNLYREDPPEFFLERMLAEGIYFGIFEGSDLVAIAGTHIVSPRYGVGGLGNIYTRPDRRRRGHCGLVASAVSQELLNAGISTIVLNVREENSAAIRVYDRLGYRDHCRYYEMIAYRR